MSIIVTVDVRHRWREWRPTIRRIRRWQRRGNKRRSTTRSCTSRRCVSRAPPPEWEAPTPTRPVGRRDSRWEATRCRRCRGMAPGSQPGRWRRGLSNLTLLGRPRAPGGPPPTTLMWVAALILGTAPAVLTVVRGGWVVDSWISRRCWPCGQCNEDGIKKKFIIIIILFFFFLFLVDLNVILYGGKLDFLFLF